VEENRINQLSEVILESELHVAVAHLGAGDLAEAGGTDAAAWITEDRVIQGILRFETELEPLSLPHAEACQQGCIEHPVWSKNLAELQIPYGPEIQATRRRFRECWIWDGFPQIFGRICLHQTACWGGGRGRQSVGLHYGGAD
jgi:hypothetical protein